MRRNNVIIKPSDEMLTKIRNARDAILCQRSRIIRCPYCRHNTIVVYDDARGHIQAKCKMCGKETVFDVVNMRRTNVFTH